MRNQLKNAMDENSSFETQIQELQETINKMDVDAQALAAQKGSMSHENQMLKEHRNQVELRVATLEAQVRTLSSALETSKQELSSLKLEKHNREVSEGAVDQMNKLHLQKKLRELQHELDAREETISLLQAERDRQTMAFELEIQQLQASLAQVKQASSSNASAKDSSSQRSDPAQSQESKIVAPKAARAPLANFNQSAPPASLMSKPAVAVAASESHVGVRAEPKWKQASKFAAEDEPTEANPNECQSQ
jgi:chromosome segregation ATPase